MQDVYKTIKVVADTTASVLILGESGTGKELVARAFHKKSSRHGQPFIAINCSAFPEQILENELFGHEQGAFTGATREKPGCFELAHQGTLFFDEIGDMTLATQVKILRVLEEQKFRRLGGKKEITVDVRVIAATNQDLSAAIKTKQFRQDLYFRLNVVEIYLPPLRERLADLPLLTKAFLQHFCHKNNKSPRHFSPQALDFLYRYDWPGNVRELRNVVERAVILSPTAEIGISALPPRLAGKENAFENTWTAGLSMAEMEKRLISQTLHKTGQNKTKAAKILGIGLKTLHNKLNKYGLRS